MSSVLHERDIFIYNGLEYRVLQVREYDVIVMQLHTEKTKLFCLESTEVNELLENDMISIVQAKQNLRYLDKEILSDASRKIYEQYELTAERFHEHSNSPEWLLEKEEKAKFIQKLALEMKCSITTARRRLRKYLQNGMALHGLDIKYDQCGGKGKARIYQIGKKPGPKGISGIVRDEETILIFDRVKQRYATKKGRANITILYTEMVRDYYSERMIVNGEACYTPYPLAKCPSKRQLYYHLKKEVDDVKKYCIKNGQRNAWNNIRALSSDTIYPLKTKGVGCCYEMDEMETDYELVQTYDRNQVIGRAVLYMIMDVFSKSIVGYSLGIDNNSWAGAEMALLNMAEDKVSYCEGKKISITQEEWPMSGVLPTEITVDNGSEYLSKQFEAYARENGLHISFAPAGMGSMKGNIEREFRNFNMKTNGLLPGQIVKDAYRQPHIRQARLTIEEFEQIVIRFILNHNKNPMNHYHDTREIYEAGIEQSPNGIWKYSCEHTNALRKITDMDQYRLSLLCSDTATITREGIVFQQMIYTCGDIQWLSYEMAKTGVGKRRKLQIKYDKRCMDRIYYVNDNQEYELAVLSEKKTSNEKYQHLSYEEILEINYRKKDQFKINEEIRLQNDVQLLAEIQQIVKNAKALHKGGNSSKNKRENRAFEKERLHREQNVISQIGQPVNGVDEELIPDEDFEKQSENRYITQEEPEYSESSSWTTEELIHMDMLKKYGITPK